MSTIMSLPALRPMVSSLLRHRLMPALLLGQIVLACAILTNVVFLLQRQLAPMLMNDGIVRNELLLVDQMVLQNGRWTTATGQRGQRTLQAIPGVRAVAPAMGLPMRQSMTFTVPLKSPAGAAVVPTGFAGDGLVQALGLDLIQGRDFNDDDYAIAGSMYRKGASGVVPIILTKALASGLFPDGHALGGRLNDGDGPTSKGQYVVVGIVGHLLRYELGELDDGHAEDALLYPMRELEDMPIMAYAVRADPARRDAVKQVIPGVIQREFGPQLMRDIPVVVETYEDQRADSFRQRRAAAWLLGSVCTVVTLITLIGIASLTGYWIEQRTRQIGIRRALGASRPQILRHFQVENLLLTSIGLLLGMPLAYAVNQWLMQHYELPRLPLMYLPIGALVLLLLGQLAVSSALPAAPRPSPQPRPPARHEQHVSTIFKEHVLIAYYFRLALRSLRRTPVMTALMVCAIGLGIGASMTMLTVLHVMTKDPIPEKSGVLYYPHLDPLPKDYPSDSEWGDPADNMTWLDAMALLHAKQATHQAAMAGAELLIWPVTGTDLPVELSGRFTTADFFPMFGLGLERGASWSAADDEGRARVVVLGRDLAQRLFGSKNPVGRQVRFNDTMLRVLGVTGAWAPQPLFYADASTKGSFGEHDDFFIPLSTSVDLHWETSGHTSGWGTEQVSDADMYTDPKTSWLQFWVQLDTPAQESAYRRYLREYAAQQHASGRFERSPDRAHLYRLMEWLQYQKLVPHDVRLQFWLAVGFLVVCLVNIVALLLAKFLRRGGEIGVRRALGAGRRDILLQLGFEAVLVGIMGGALGIALAELGLWGVRQRPDPYAHAAQMDTTMLVLTIVMSILATLLAGLLPAWRASRIAPALQIKAA